MSPHECKQKKHVLLTCSTALVRKGAIISVQKSKEDQNRVCSVGAQQLFDGKLKTSLLFEVVSKAKKKFFFQLEVKETQS